MQAEMDVHAAAGAVGHRHGREADAVTEAKGCGARELAGDHRLVCRLQRRLRGDGQLVLARAIFRQEGVRLEPCSAKRGDDAFAELALPPPGAEAVSMAGTLLHPGIDELLLEGGDEVQPARGIERGDGAAQELARAAFPRGTVGVADVAEKEVLDRRAVVEIDAHLGGHIRHHHEIAAGAEWRIENDPERVLHQIGVGPADALLLASG